MRDDVDPTEYTHVGYGGREVVRARVDPTDPGDGKWNVAVPRRAPRDGDDATTVLP